MFKVSLFFVCLGVAAANAAPGVNVSSDDPSHRIVGGFNAAVGEAPYQASLRTPGNHHFCGGSIISAYAILTAAHCVVGKTPSMLNVVVGTIYLNSGGTKYDVSRISVHPYFDSSILNNDVAVVITSTPISGSPAVSSIPLSTETLGAGVSVKLTGWGRTNKSDNHSIPNNLQSIILKTISVSDCKTKLVKIGDIYSTHLCTFTRAGEGACQGDSGGPLVADGQLVGIVSWGSPCAIGYPDVFTRVSSFVEWIINNSQF